MSTQMQKAREGKLTDEMKLVAAREHKTPEEIRELIATGRVVLCANVNHQNLKPCAVGEGLSVKVNANIGHPAPFLIRHRSF